MLISSFERVATLPRSSPIAYFRDLFIFTQEAELWHSSLCQGMIQASLPNYFPQSLLRLGWSTVNFEHWLFFFVA